MAVYQTLSVRVESGHERLGTLMMHNNVYICMSQKKVQLVCSRGLLNSAFFRFGVVIT